MSLAVCGENPAGVWYTWLHAKTGEKKDWHNVDLVPSAVCKPTVLPLVMDPVYGVHGQNMEL